MFNVRIPIELLVIDILEIYIITFTYLFDSSDNILLQMFILWLTGKSDLTRVKVRHSAPRVSLS